MTSRKVYSSWNSVCKSSEELVGDFAHVMLYQLSTTILYHNASPAWQNMVGIKTLTQTIIDYNALLDWGFSLTHCYGKSNVNQTWCSGKLIQCLVNVWSRSSSQAQAVKYQTLKVNMLCCRKIEVHVPIKRLFLFKTSQQYWRPAQTLSTFVSLFVLHIKFSWSKYWTFKKSKSCENIIAEKRILLTPI